MILMPSRPASSVALLTGGKGTIWGTLIGALLMAVIRNGLNLMGASNDIQYIVIGAVIILAVTIDVFRNKAEAKPGRWLPSKRTSFGAHLKHETAGTAVPAVFPVRPFRRDKTAEMC